MESFRRQAAHVGSCLREKASLGRGGRQPHGGFQRKPAGAKCVSEHTQGKASIGKTQKGIQEKLAFLGMTVMVLPVLQMKSGEANSLPTIRKGH